MTDKRTQLDHPEWAQAEARERRATTRRQQWVETLKVGCGLTFGSLALSWIIIGLMGGR